MNTNKDISNQLKNYIDETDNLMAKNILEMLEVKQPSLWFRNETIEDENEEINVLVNEERTLSYEDIKEMYPDWFKE